MKNSAIYSIALASVLVLSLVDVEARGLGAGGGVQQQQAPHVQQQQAPTFSSSKPPTFSNSKPLRVQQQQAPHVQQQQAFRSSGRTGGGIVTSAPSMSRLPQGQAQSFQRQVNRPSQANVQSLQGAPQASRQSQERVQSLQRAPQASRPTQGQVQHFLNLPKASEGAKPGRGTIGAAVVGGSAATLALQRLNRPGSGDAHRRDSDTGRIDRTGIGDNRHGANPPVAQQIRNDYRQQNILDNRWWANHPHLANEYWHNQVWHNRDWHYWWQPATWAIAAGWFPWGWSSPVSYDFGDNVLYDNDIVYMNGEQVATADEYYQQATQLASTAKDDTANRTEWLPLGVFALSRGDTGASNMVLQLAVSKEGIISGTYYNSDTDIARPVKGTVDKKTQRAAWTFADGKDTNIVMEAGMNNLTQDQSELLVHFGKDMTQQWLMVRLQEPPAQKNETGDSAVR